MNEIFERRRKEIRAKTVRDQPLTRFQELSGEIPADLPENKKTAAAPTKKKDEEGYM